MQSFTWISLYLMYLHFHMTNVRSVLTLSPIRATPTRPPNALAGSFLQRKAAVGAAIAPPIKSATTISQKNLHLIESFAKSRDRLSVPYPQDRFRYLSHCPAAISTTALDAQESFVLRQPIALYEDLFGSVNYFSRGHCFFEARCFLLQGLPLL